MRKKRVETKYGTILSHDFYVEEVMAILSQCQNDEERKEVLKTFSENAVGFAQMFDRLANPNEEKCLTEEQIDGIIERCSGKSTPTGYADTRLHIVLGTDYKPYYCKGIENRICQEVYMLSDLEITYLKDYLLGKPIEYADVWNEIKTEKE